MKSRIYTEIKDLVRTSKSTMSIAQNLDSLFTNVNCFLKTSRHYAAPIKPFKIIDVPTHNVENILMGKGGRSNFRYSDDVPEVHDGDWDEHVYPIVKMQMYLALKDRFILGKEWGETEWYWAIRKTIDEGGSKFGCNTTEQLDLRLKGLEDLADFVSRNGILRQRDAINKDAIVDFWRDRRPLRNPETNDITVNIDRGGRFILHEGRHRVMLAHILSIPSIPCRVKVRHKEWQRFRDAIALGQCPRIGHPDMEF